jgi:hypothetical protein
MVSDCWLIAGPAAVKVQDKSDGIAAADATGR